MKQKSFVVCGVEGVEPRVADDKFVVMGKLSVWQIRDVMGDKSGYLRDEMLSSLGYPRMENCKYQTKDNAHMVQFAS